MAPNMRKEGVQEAQSLSFVECFDLEEKVESRLGKTNS